MYSRNGRAFMLPCDLFNVEHKDVDTSNSYLVQSLILTIFIASQYSHPVLSGE